MKGGYKIIDFKNASLSGTPVTMTDVLVDLLNNYEKVVLLSHVVLSGSAKDDCFSTVLSDGAGGVKLNCYDGYISINSSGAVTYTVASPSGMTEDIAELTAEIGDLDDLETTEKDSVVGAVNELKDNLSVNSIVLEPASGVTVVIASVGKSADICVLNATLQKDFTGLIGTNVTLTTLPEGFRPLETVRGVCFNGTKKVSGYFAVSTNGNVIVDATSAFVNEAAQNIFISTAFNV